MPLVSAWVSYFSCSICYWSFGISPDFQDSYCFRDKTYFQTHFMCFGKSSWCFPSIYWSITNIKHLKAKSEVAQSCPTLCNPGLQPARLLCPWNSPGKNTRVGCYFLLQGIFPTQGSNPCLLYLLHCRQILYHWSTWEALKLNMPLFKQIGELLCDFFLFNVLFSMFCVYSLVVKEHRDK